MEGLVSGVFAEILKLRREEFNTTFAVARRANRQLTGHEFSEHLTTVVAPLVNKASSFSEPYVCDKLACVLYDLSLELFAPGCFGKRNRYPLVAQAWKELFPLSLHLLVQSPYSVAASISNALYNLTREKSGDEDLWLSLMKAAAPECDDSKSFLEAGTAAAWRSGMAHYRKGALEVCRNLTPALFAKIFGLPLDTINSSSMETIIKQLEIDNWYDPAKSSQGANAFLSLITTVGGFCGYGGSFISPPGVKVLNGEIILYDREYYWTLYADIFGAVLHLTGKGRPKGSSESNRALTIDKMGNVRKNKTKKTFSQLSGASSIASTHDTLVVCMPQSHYAFVVACTGG